MRRYDDVLVRLADYVVAPLEESAEAYATARLCLMDAIGCGLLALRFPACHSLVSPLISGVTVSPGCHIPGTDWVMDPVSGAFSLGAMIRWLDYNDTWLAAEWGHPSDQLGGLLALGDFLSRRGDKKLSIRDLLVAAIKAYEIQGVLALGNSFNRIGLDHVILVRVGTAALATHLLGGSHEQVLAALSQAWIDGAPLRCYRQAPNTGSRKSWAAADATSRGVFLALLTLKGEPGYLSALSAKTWGFHDVFLKGEPLILARPLGTYVMENILFKASFPAEFHAQTAVEAAIQLHAVVRDHLDAIEAIILQTHESAIRIIDKQGSLTSPADRDHCLQYMVAIGLLHGRLTADDYEEEVARDLRIDQLRECMRVVEEPQYSRDYLDPDKRSSATRLILKLSDGSTHAREVEYPLGHRRRRQEAHSFLYKKFEENSAALLPKRRIEELIALFQDPDRLDALPVHRFHDLFIYSGDYE